MTPSRPATKRRPKGSGGLFQRCDPKAGCPPLVNGVRPEHKCKGLWVGRVDVGITKDGTRRRRMVSSKSKAEAQRKLVELQRQVASRKVAPVGGGRVTVKAWLDAWLVMHAETVRPTTLTTDTGTIRKWIVPTIGHVRLSDLAPADLRALRAAIVGAGRKSTTARHCHTVLMKALKDAVAEGHHIPDSVFAAKKPRPAPNDRAAIPVEQALAILQAVTGRPDAPRWVLGLSTGIRQGEALGLLWDHVDFETERILVEWQLQHLPASHVAPDGWRARKIIGNAWLTETKTAAGEREIGMSGLLLAAMHAARETWQENPWGLVWVDGRGLPVRDYADRAAWHEIQGLAGVAHPSGRPWHVHECRHTVATLLKRKGATDAVLEQILGQSRLVKSYVHTDADDTMVALEGLAGQLGG